MAVEAKCLDGGVAGVELLLSVVEQRVESLLVGREPCFGLMCAVSAAHGNDRCERGCQGVVHP